MDLHKNFLQIAVMNDKGKVFDFLRFLFMQVFRFWPPCGIPNAIEDTFHGFGNVSIKGIYHYFWQNKCLSIYAIAVTNFSQKCYVVLLRSYIP